MGSFFQSKGWHTVTGLALSLLGYLLSPQVLSLLPPKWSSAVTAIGAALAAFGIYHRVASIDNAANGAPKP